MPMQRPASSARATAAFDRVADDLSGDGAGRGTMFGMTCLKARGKAFAGLWGDAIVVKVAGDAHAAALSLKGSHLFDPSDMGRPMKEWVVVPIAHATRWPSLARAALDYVP